MGIEYRVGGVNSLESSPAYCVLNFRKDTSMLNAQQSVVKNEGTTFIPIPQGVYEVEIVDISFKPKEAQKAGKFEAKDKYYIHLGILTEGEYRGKPLTHFVTTSYNAGFSGGQSSKLYDLACAVMGEKLNDKVQLDLNTLIGGVFNIVVKEKATADGKVFANIVEVMSKTKGSQSKPLTDEEKRACMPKVEGEAGEDVDITLDLPDLNPGMDKLKATMKDLKKEDK